VKEAADKTKTFHFQWDDIDDTVHGPAMGPDDAAVRGFEPVLPVATIPSVGGANTPPGTPISNLGTPLMQCAMPPSGESMDSEGAPLRYRTIVDLLDDTEDVQDFEYSGLCLVVAEEPRSVQEAMMEEC